jgi:hypothetical protein
VGFAECNETDTLNDAMPQIQHLQLEMLPGFSNCLFVLKEAYTQAGINSILHHRHYAEMACY